MKRFSAVALASAVLLALFTFGCEQKKAPVVETAPPPPTQHLNVDNIPAAENTPPAQPTVTADPVPAPTEPIETVEPAPASPKAHKSSKAASTKAKPKERYAANSKASGKTYTVKSGDTLQEISQKYYGTTKTWRKIFNANKSKIKDPAKLPVGVKLEIP